MVYERAMKIFEYPFWFVGFRPLFTAAFVSGTILPLVWSLMLMGHMIAPPSAVSPIHWHAHEMLFGFGWAVLGGFLLTASKNWLKIRGMHGGFLALALLLWIFERGIIFYVPYQEMNFLARFLLLNSFILYVGGYIVMTLIRYRKNDAFSDNYFFIIALPLFIISKVLILTPEYFNYGTAMAIGLFRVAFVVMFERTITQFMKNSMKVELLRNKYLDLSIKGLTLLAVFQAFMLNFLSISILSIAATLLLVRFLMWKPLLAFQKFEIGIMYAGYMGLVLHLYLEAIKIAQIHSGIGTLATHAFTFLCMGLIIPSMLIRICQGHTGRTLIFTASDKLGIYLMSLAAFSRLIMTQIIPTKYMLWASISGLGWTLCFLIIGIRLTPFLFKPRVDGKIH